MNYEHLIYDKQGQIAWVKINRPEVLNALSPALVVELKNVFLEIYKDPTIRVVILRGEGRAFSAGVDLKEMNKSIQGGKFTQAEIIDIGREMINLIQTMPKVAICMINGHCFTGALELALVFDILMAAEDAKIGDTHAKWGIAPKWGMTQRLPQMIGILKARELSFTAQPISGKEAARIGLVNHAYPVNELEGKVIEMAEQICQNSPQTIAAMKNLYYQGMHTTLKEGLDIEAEAEHEITDREHVLREFEKNK